MQPMCNHFPREEISMAEVHDCFSITEAIFMEDLQFSPRGKVREDINSGSYPEVHFLQIIGDYQVGLSQRLNLFGGPARSNLLENHSPRGQLNSSNIRYYHINTFLSSKRKGTFI